MRIKITNMNDPLIIKELAVINQGFFTEWEFVADDAELVFDFPELAMGEKNDYLKLYFEFLTEYSGLTQPWGLMNAMRPNKLVHSMKRRGLSDAEIRTNLQQQYLVSDEKLDLLLDVANRQLAVIPDLYDLENAVSLYIGIPFCPTRCSYCTFAAYAHEPNKKWVAPFLEALYEEINLIGAYLREHKIRVTTLYLGGGTPTMLDVGDLEDLLTILCQQFVGIREITVEAGRPDSLSEEKLVLLKEFNVTRISINPQSFTQETLDAIGRHHTVESVVEQFYAARDKGIDNINMDLIVGLPNEQQAELAHSLSEIKKLNPESLTVHMLAFKRKSELTDKRTLYPTITKETLTEMAVMTYDFAKSESYEPYYLYRQKNIAGNLENIGYAKDGHACQYNILMMEEAQTVLGLGVGASSKFLIGESVHNPKDIKTYIDNYAEYAKRKLELLELSLRIGAKAFVYNAEPTE